MKLREAISNGVYSLYNGWVKVPKREVIPTELNLEPELSELESEADTLKTVEDIDVFIDKLYKMRQSGLLKDGEYSKENQIFKEFKSMGILRKMKDKKVELENKELSLEDSVFYNDIPFGDEENNNYISDEFGDTSIYGDDTYLIGY